MSVFVDTSALMAVMVAADDHHERAARAWLDLLAAGEELVTTNYVLLETCALLQRRHAVTYLHRLGVQGLPVLRVEWISPEQHQAALAAVLAANRRDLSLVDCASFIVMRELGIMRAFALDPHFREQGFEVIPSDVLP